MPKFSSAVRRFKRLSPPLVLALSLSFLACASQRGQVTSQVALENQACYAASPLQQYLEQANLDLRQWSQLSHEKQWAYMTDIRPETRDAAARAEEQIMAERSALIAASSAFKAEDSLCPDHRRQLMRIKTAESLAPPKAPEAQKELAAIQAELVAHYGTAQACQDDGKCQKLNELSRILAQSRREDELRRAWEGWHNAFDGEKSKYQRFVELSNQGAQDIGFANTAELWLSGYDMDGEAFRAEAQKLWTELKPFYDSLHCYVRAKLSEHYGPELVALDKPIPAHLLGNMWAQEWSAIYPLVEPYADAPSLDVDAGIRKKKLDALALTQLVEKFYLSLGMRALPKSFWTQSMFVKPDDKEVVCHASAWDMDTKGDVRIKMCIEADLENFYVIQHELGHIYYYLYYNHLPFIYQSGANDGFHEGIGDTLMLSMTSKYMQEIGLLDSFEANEKTIINEQMKSALDKVAFLPFGLLIDTWRWGVFDGSISPENYNRTWWELKEKLQGVAAPSPRGEEHFDAGAKYHVPANTPYLRYFLARILQFQFHQALCQAAGWQGPLHQCSIYQSKEAGQKLMELLAAGASEPWQETLFKLTGSREMSAQALMEYYAPLKAFLDRANASRQCSF